MKPQNISNVGKKQSIRKTNTKNRENKAAFDTVGI